MPIMPINSVHASQGALIFFSFSFGNVMPQAGGQEWKIGVYPV